MDLYYDKCTMLSGYNQLIERALYELKADKLEHSDRWLTAVIASATALEKASKLDRFFGFDRLFDIHLKSLSRNAAKNLSGELRFSTLSRIFVDCDNLSVSADLLRDQFHAAIKDEYEKSKGMFPIGSELDQFAKTQLAHFEELTPDQFREMSSPYDAFYTW